VLSIRSQQLGQYAPGYASQPYGYVDPLVDAGLTAAGAALAPGDPGAPQTFQLVRRIIVAPPFLAFAPPSGPPAPRKLSDLNPALETVAWVKENQGLAALLVLSVPVAAFLLGRSTR
jgi:hypothetical protein